MNCLMILFCKLRQMLVQKLILINLCPKKRKEETLHLKCVTTNNMPFVLGFLLGLSNLNN